MFPSELLQYPQWVCWKRAVTDDGRPTKLPYNPITGQLASVADPKSWTDFNTAAKVASNGAFYSGIGFVLTNADPYCFIDLDDPAGDPAIIDRHKKIAEAMDSYSELSPSGFGLHIIVRAQVAGGRRRGKVELYSSSRYMTMTGNTYHDKPIQDRSYLVQQLWDELGDQGNRNNGIGVTIVDQEQRQSDEEIYSIASTAENGDKFCDLWQGSWETYYKSQSEADFALINLLGFYSRNIEQIRRMFMLSSLGKRDKAKRRSYVDAMIKRSFDNLPPELPLEEIKISLVNQLMLKTAADDKAAAEKEQALNPFAGPLFASVPDPEYDWTVPPGLLGEIATFIHASAPRPVKEIALAAAIGLMAGICGRAYNVSATGLNQYVLILAKTGTGKEAAASGIDRLLEAVKQSVPSAMEFLGPADIVSGQALIKYLGKHPCFLSIVGEFGLALQVMCSPHASAAQVGLRKNLLSLYNKSGASDTLRETVYSDKEKNTEIVRSPAFSLLGESTPESFYASMDETMIAQGLMPRFTCVEYGGNRPPLNENHQNVKPSAELIMRVGELAANCLVMAHHQRTLDVKLDSEAETFSNSINRAYDAKINTSELEIARQLWNRAHIKTLKLAALIAIGIDPYHPLILDEHMKWAAQLVERDINNILSKFDMGKVGRADGEVSQMHDLSVIVKEYVTREAFGLARYGVIPTMHSDRIIPISYLQRRLLSKNSFKQDRIGGTAAIKRCLDSLVAEGVIRAVRELDMYQRYGKTMKAYYVSDPERFK